MTTTPTSGAAIQPVLWVSPEQFANFMDADEAQFGRYVPARKTSAGNFTMPLFAAPAQPAAEPAGVVSEMVKFTDQSTANPIEKARRYLAHVANKKPNSPYFFDDGYPRESIADDAAAAQSVLEQLAAPQPSPTAQAADNVQEDAARETRRMFDAGWKAAALFCDREDVAADGIIGFGACPQFEAAFSAAHGPADGESNG